MSQQPPKMSRFRKIGNTVYTSGVTAKPGDVPTQIRNSFEKLRAVLSEAGSSFDKVVKVNIYLSDLGYREQYLNQIWNEYFGNLESDSIAHDDRVRARCRHLRGN